MAEVKGHWCVLHDSNNSMIVNKLFEVKLTQLVKCFPFLGFECEKYSIFTHLFIHLV